MSGNRGVTIEQLHDGGGRQLRIAPGLVVAVLGLILLVVIGIGIVASQGNGTTAAETLTVAELRESSDRYDNQGVRVEGVVDDVRELPYLSQYAVYTLRDETGSIYVLTEHGAPPSTPTGQRYGLDATYHSRVTLDDELRRVVEDRLGPIAGELVVRLLPGIPINVVFLEHERYEPLEMTE